MASEELTKIIQSNKIDKKEKLGRRILLFSIICFLVNYYVLSSFYTLIEKNKGSEFGIILFLLTTSYLIGAAALRYFNNVFAKILNVIGSAWLGSTVIATTTLLLSEALYFLGFLEQSKKFAFAFSLLTIFVTFSIILAMMTFTKKIIIKNKKIKNPLRIIQISDLHVGAAHKKNFLERIVRRVNKEKPDITFITGDLIDGKHKYPKNYFDSLKKISSPVFMVTGNHERMTGMKIVKGLLKNSAVTLLQNKKIKIKGITIIGLDDTEKTKTMINQLKKIKTNKDSFNVLLFHRPKKFKKAVSQGIDLMLTGHTHGGQIFPLNIFMSFYYDKVYGLKKFKNSYLYVSSGTGWWGPPLRFGSINEITVIDLIKE